MQIPEPSQNGVAGRGSNTDAEPAEAAPRNWMQQQTVDRWRDLPARYKVVFATSMSFVVCNMDKCEPAFRTPFPPELCLLPDLADSLYSMLHRGSSLQPCCSPA